MCAHRSQPLLIANDCRTTVHAQGLTDAGNQAQHSDATGLQNIAMTIEPFVAGAVGNQKRAVVDDVDKSRCIAAR